MFEKVGSLRLGHLFKAVIACRYRMARITAKPHVGKRGMAELAEVQRNYLALREQFGLEISRAQEGY